VNGRNLQQKITLEKKKKWRFLKMSGMEKLKIRGVDPAKYMGNKNNHHFRGKKLPYNFSHTIKCYQIIQFKMQNCSEAWHERKGCQDTH